MPGIAETLMNLFTSNKNKNLSKIFDGSKSDVISDSLFLSNEIIYTIDHNYMISWANKEALSYNPKAIGKKCHELIYESSVACQNCKCQIALKTNIVQTSLILSNFKNGNGHQTYINEIVLPLVNENNSRFAAMIICSPVENIMEYKEGELQKVTLQNDKKDFIEYLCDNYEQIFENQHLPLCITGNNLRIKYSNEAFAKILETKRDSLFSELITEVLPEISTIGTQKILTLVVSGVNEQNYELNLEQFADSKKVVLSISPIKYTDAKINGLIWKLEPILRANVLPVDFEDKTRFSRNFGIMTIDLEGKVIQWNEFMTNLFGWTEKELLGVVNPIISPTLLNQYLNDKNTDKIELVTSNREKKRVDIKISLFPVYDDAGLISNCVCLIENTTFDKFIKSEFKELEERYNNFIKRFEGITFKFDNTFLPTYFNGSILPVTGYTEEEFLSGKISFRDIIYSDDIILLEDFIKKINNKIRTVKELELRIVAKNGTIKWIHFYFQNTFDDRGNITQLQGFLYNITQRKEAEEELRRSREQFRTLAMYVEKAREDEKKHLALEIHDELGHALTALKLELAWVMKKKFLRQEIMFEKVRKMNEIIEATIRKVRTISSQLRPSVLDHFGLEAALEWQAGEFQKRSAVRCKLQLDTKEIKINEQTSTAIFRIFQEILTNIAKHAKATRVDVIFEKSDSELMLKVRDNGKGFKTENIKYTKSLGILGMTERANALGGLLTVNSVLGIGTTVTLVIPLVNIEG